ncbi:hypothetical protein V8F20_011376 [Naviculisporaceae sp. PSN 640]
MDAVAALSVAAAAIQFVDWSRKIVCKSRELYRSTNGVLEENLGSQTATIRLKELSTAVSNELSQNSWRLGTGSRLHQICAECATICDELLARLHRLEVPNGITHRGWKSFRQALKSVWSKGEIDEMAKRLGSLRSEIGTEMLLAVSERLTLLTLENKDEMKAIDSGVRSMLVELSGKIATKDIMNSIAELEAHQREQFRELLVSTLESKAEFRRLGKESRETTQTLIDNLTLAIHRFDEHLSEIGSRLELDREDLARQRCVSAKLVQEDNQKRLNRVRYSLLDSLRFDRMDERPMTIAKAHKRTYEWIFRDPSMARKPWSNFASWLKCDSGIYWINGKPGSGKSTLMKYIWTSSQTRGLLRRWATGSKYLSAAFFFWNSGDESQRSHEGLYRTILHQTLGQDLDLISRVLPKQWKRATERAACDMEIQKETWAAPGQLKEALETLISLASPQMRLCFFIDGLDEVEGDPGDIANFFDEMASQPTSPWVKFCVSSRPWSVFDAVFYDRPSLRLQDLTLNDIRLFVADTLGANRSLQRILRYEPDIQRRFAEEIVRRSMGVFLWVTLAVKLLVRGIQDGDSAEELYRRLLTLPPDLEAFYGQILKQVKEQYPEESSKIFQVFRASGNTLNILMLSMALEYPDSEYKKVMSKRLVLKQEVLSDGHHLQLKSQIDRWARKLNSRCLGFLEASDDYALEESEWDAWKRYLKYESGEEENRIYPVYDEPMALVPIRYLHRTARDDLEDPRRWEDLASMTKSKSFCPHTALLVGWVLAVKSVPFATDKVVCPKEQIVLATRGLKLSAIPSPCLFGLLGELDRTLHARNMESRMTHDEGSAAATWNKNGTHFDFVPGHLWHGELPIWQPQNPTEQWDYMADQRGVPLVFAPLERHASGPGLALALLLSQWKSWLSNPVPKKVPEPGSIPLVASIVATDSNAVHSRVSGHSLWALTVHLVHVFHSMYPDDENFTSWLQVFQLMIDHGADPHITCLEGRDFGDVIGGSEWFPPKVVGRHHQHLETGMGEYWCLADDQDTCSHTVEAVVRDVFVSRQTEGADKLLASTLERKGSETVDG